VPALLLLRRLGAVRVDRVDELQPDVGQVLRAEPGRGLHQELLGVGEPVDRQRGGQVVQGLHDAGDMLRRDRAGPDRAGGHRQLRAQHLPGDRHLRAERGDRLDPAFGRARREPQHPLQQIGQPARPQHTGQAAAVDLGQHIQLEGIQPAAQRLEPAHLGQHVRIRAPRDKPALDRGQVAIQRGAQRGELRRHRTALHRIHDPNPSQRVRHSPPHRPTLSP
jgi:hypothetical protein